MSKHAHGDLIENTFVIGFCTSLDFLASNVLFPQDPVIVKASNALHNNKACATQSLSLGPRSIDH
jgi:hypothetical protein